MAHSATRSTVLRFADLVLASGTLFHYARRPHYFGTWSKLQATLNLAPGERLLDVGCGTGVFAPLARGRYVGIDTARRYLHFGQGRNRNGRRCSFVAMSVLELGFADDAFDKALVANLVHHLDAAAIDRLFTELSRVVAKQVVLMDAVPEMGNRLERFLLRHDRGDFVRERATLRQLIARHFDIESEIAFHNMIHTIPQIIFSLRPRVSRG